jgi:riboflavin biosynthesis pyrimidine reductase
LRVYRRERLGKVVAPLCAILTRSGNLPLDHALFSDETQKVVLSATAPSSSLVHALAGRAEVVHLENLDARSACGWLAARGHGLVSVEAGPSTASTLYGQDSPVTELALSLYEGALEGVELGGALPPDLTTHLTLRSEVTSAEESGRWRFTRWTTG